MGFVAFDSVGYDDGQPKIGPLKLGQFVKGLVLISPVIQFRDSPALAAMRQIADPLALQREAVLKRNNVPEEEWPVEVYHYLSVMIVAGNKPAGNVHYQDAEKLNSLFKNARPREDDLKLVSRSLIFLPNVDTSLQGCKLLDAEALNMPNKIASFIKLRIINNAKAKKWAWRCARSRTSDAGGGMPSRGHHVLMVGRVGMLVAARERAYPGDHDHGYMVPDMVPA